MAKHKSLLLFFISLWIVLSIVFANEVVAQNGSATTGAIVGNIKDPTGQVIVSATVTIRNLSNNLTRTLETDEKGFYFLSQLAPGNYEINIIADGFLPSTEKLNLNLGTTAVIDSMLMVSGQNDVIEIIDSTLVNKNKTESSTNIDRNLINSLPINQRNFMNFSLTAPRVTRDPVPSQGILDSSGLSINGQSARSNNLTIDGLSNNELSSGGTLSTFSQEAVEEFQVITDNFSAEIGRALAGTINIVTKSGGSELNGNVFLGFRNNELSARNAFSTINPEFKQYQFGATLSGQIKKEKAFFFSSFERLSTKQNNIVTISDQTLAALNRQGFSQRNGAIPFAIANTSVLLKTDFIISNKDLFSLRYNNGNVYNGAQEQFGGLVGDTSGGQLKANDNSIAFNNTYFDSNLTNETRFIFTRRNRRVLFVGTQPQVQIVVPEGAVRIGQRVTLPQDLRQNIFQFINNTTLNYSKHSLKFGIDFLSVSTLPSNSLRLLEGGAYTFDAINFSQFTGIEGLPSFTSLEALDPSLRTPEQKAFLSFLATNPNNLFPGLPQNLPLANSPLPSLFMQGFGNNKINIDVKFFSGFIQDEIRLKPNLLLRAGLRYDINKISDVPDNKGNFSPRISFSYSPRNISALQIKGAYGIFFGTVIGGVSAFAQAFDRGLKVLTLPLPYSAIPLQFADKRFPNSNNLPQDVIFIPQLSIFGQVDKKFRYPYSHQATLGLSFLASKNTLLSADYVYVRGLKIFTIRDINPIVRQVGINPLQSFIEGRVDPSRGLVFNVESAYDSYYHALTLNLNQKLRNRLELLVNYTYSKAIDNVTDFNVLLSERGDELRPGLDRGLALQDVRSRFVFSNVLDIGYSKSRLLKDFQISSIITLETGKAYNLLAGADLNLSGDNPPGDRPLQLGRNVGILPGFATVDLRLTRKIKFKETFSLQTTLEVFNLFNKVNISEIDRTFPPDMNGNFQLPKKDGGRFIAPRERFRGAFAPRQFQVGIKVFF